MTLQIMRRLGVIAILVTGAVHLQQYLGDYQDVPTIGPLFLLNAIGAAVVAVGLLLPLQRWLGERRGDVAVGLRRQAARRARLEDPAQRRGAFSSGSSVVHTVSSSNGCAGSVGWMPSLCTSSGLRAPACEGQ